MEEKILKLRKEGKTLNEISKILSCATSTVSYHLKNNNMGGTLNLEFISDVDEDVKKRIIELRLKNWDYNEILKEVNISKDKLKKIIRIVNLNYNLNRRKANDIKKEDVLEKYNELKSLKKVAKFFGVTRDTIRNFVSDDDVLNNKKNRKKMTRSQSVISWRKRKKDELIYYKGGECQCCGYNKSKCALHFHHINPQEKDFSVSKKSYSFERLKKEVDKCILVCSNCHAEIHEEINQFGESKIVNKVLNKNNIAP
jgi:predicted transcriptional regulator/transcription elongation factor Elf1